MLILNLIRLKVNNKLIIFFTKYIRKYMNMVVKWTPNDLIKGLKWLSEKIKQAINLFLNVSIAMSLTQT